MDRLDGLRLGDRQEVVASGEVSRVVGELGAAKIVLAESELLDHGAHGTVQNEYPLSNEPREGIARRGAIWCVHGGPMACGKDA